jgi:lipopolysaccharide transport system permease protein
VPKNANPTKADQRISQGIFQNMLIDKISAIWTYRGFILGSVRREFQVRYRNSLLGSAWAILNPLAMILVYTLIFSQVMRAKLPGIDSSFGYSIYLCSGILTWGLFAEIVGRGQNVFLENANMIKKINFPRICLPIIVIVNAGLNFIIIFGLFSLFLLISGNFPGWPYLAVFPVLAVQVMFSIGLAIIFGVLNVFFRDVGQFVGVLLQFWFWFTPVVYPAAIVPERFQPLMDLNPMKVFISAYQDILLNGTLPSWVGLLPVMVLTLAVCLFAVRLFRKRSGEMVDEL